MAVRKTVQLIEKSIGSIDINYDMNINHINDIRNMSSNQFDMICNGFRFGYMQGMKAAKANMRRGKKNPKKGSRALKIHELIELAGRIPDKRLDALLCWAHQYQEEGSVSNAI